MFLNANELKIVEQDYQSITCEWQSQNYKIVPEGDYVRVEFAEIPSHTAQYGKAMLPAAFFPFQIPGNVSSIEILDKIEETVALKTQIFPLQLPKPDVIGEKEQPFVKNEKFYCSTKVFPKNIVKVDAKGIMRGRKIANIRIVPVQYVPSQKEIKVITRLRFRIVYEAVERQADTDGVMDVIAEGLVTNYTPSRSDRGVESKYELLILTASTLEAEARKFAEWKKKQQGYSVAIESFTSTTVDDVKKVLKKYYTEYKTKYFLIFGDYDVFPMPKTTYNHPYHGSKFPTDVIYACVDGDDYYPDMYHGRIPASNAAQAKTMVDKIIGYQKNPEPGDWYNRFCLCGEYQNSTYSPTKAQRLFCETAYVIYANFKGEYQFPTNPTVGANASPGSGDTFYFHSGSLSYRTLQGQALDKDWQKRITDKVTAGKNTKEFWNQGAFLVQHRDHGSYTGWGKPQFGISDIKSLRNGRKLPVLFSINCLTGGLDQSSDCFAEAAIKHDQGGAVAVFAATRVSYSGWNDNLCDGFYTCFKKGYKTFAKNAQNFTNKYPTSQKLGVILCYGKYYMMKNKGTGTQCQLSFDLFQCYGDPTMDIRSKRPARLNTNYPKELQRGDSFRLNLTKEADRSPVANALVCLYNAENDQQIKGRTDGQGNIQLDLYGATPGIYTLTITGQNLRPVQSTIEIK